MKTIKIDELVHEELLQIKGYYGYKTLSETIDMCIGEFWYRNMPYENPSVRRIKKDDQSKK